MTIENFIIGLKIRRTKEGRTAMRIIEKYASNHSNFSDLDNIKERAMEVDDVVQDYLNHAITDVNQRKWLHNYYIQIKSDSTYNYHKY